MSETYYVIARQKEITRRSVSPMELPSRTPTVTEKEYLVGTNPFNWSHKIRDAMPFESGLGAFHYKSQLDKNSKMAVWRKDWARLVVNEVKHTVKEVNLQIL